MHNLQPHMINAHMGEIARNSAHAQHHVRETRRSRRLRLSLRFPLIQRRRTPRVPAPAGS
jgi:hypothetical protein